MRIRWQTQALSDIYSLHRYIARDDELAASALVARIRSIVETTIPSHPRIGKPGRVDGTRELVIAKTPFVVVYRIAPDAIEILSVRHAMRLWPDRFG